MRTESNFSVTGWEQAPWGEDEQHLEGPRLERATVRKRFRGGLEGESLAELLLCQADPADHHAGAGYVASERFTGRLDGRMGTFVLQHGGLSGPGLAPRTFGSVVPGSGTGELAGLRGDVVIAVDDAGRHTMTLDYELG